MLSRYFVLFLFVSILVLTVRAGAVEPTSCDPTNGPCSCDGSAGEVGAVTFPPQLPFQEPGVTGFATASSNTDMAIGDENADSCGGVGQCLTPSGNADGRTAMFTGDAEIDSDYVPAGVVNVAEANPAGLAAAVADLASYRVELCGDPLSISSVNLGFTGIQEADLSEDPPVGLGPGFGAYEWIDFFVIVTDANGDDYVAFEQHGVDGRVDDSPAGKFNTPLLGSVSGAPPGHQGGRTFTFEQGELEVRSVTAYFNGQGGFAYIAGESFHFNVGTAGPEACDPTNSPCSCDGSRGETEDVLDAFPVPAQLPNQADGVTGYALASTLPPVALFDDDADPCAGIGQCLRISPSDQPAGSGFGRTAIALGSGEVSLDRAAVIADAGANPPGLAAAVENLASYGVRLCAPTTFGAVRFNFQGIQVADLSDPDTGLGPGFGAYEWLDFFIVVTDAVGDEFVVFEQHGTECPTPPCGSGPGGKINAPDLGGVSNVNAPGLQGNRTYTFEQGELDVQSVTVYFNGQGGFGYIGGSTFELVSFDVLPAVAACDPTNGPCSCDGSAGETDDVLDAFPSPPLLPLQAGATGYATATSITEQAIGDPNADPCGGVGQCLLVSPNDQPFNSGFGRTAMFTHGDGTDGEITPGYRDRPVINDATANPPGLNEAVALLVGYRVNLCSPLSITEVEFNFVARQEAEMGIALAPGEEDTPYGAYEWLDFYLVVTDSAGDNYLVFEQHGTECDFGGPLECDDSDAESSVIGRRNVPTLGTVSNPDAPGLQGDRTYTFEQGVLEATSVTAYFNGQGGFAYVGGATFRLIEGSGFRVDILQSGGGTRVDEDEPALTDTYTVVLGQEPLEFVDVELSFDDTQIDVFPDSLSFTRSDWDIPQVVTVTVVDDSILEDPTHLTTITHEAFGSGFDDITADVVVSITDNDGIPLGACCTLGVCADVTQADCEAGGGLYVGDGILCAAINCPDPGEPGACCTGGVCTDAVFQAECEAGGGTFQGEGSDCGGVTCGTPFRRGDHDGSGVVDITDSLNRLGFLFLGTTPSECQEASDFDNSGAVDITDSLNELTHLFLGTVTPPPPGTMDCGPDPTEIVEASGGLPQQEVISLGCEKYPSDTGIACP